MKLYNGGAYLVNGTEIVVDDSQAAAVLKAKTGKEISKEEASKQTIAYDILKSHYLN